MCSPVPGITLRNEGRRDYPEPIEDLPLEKPSRKNFLPVSIFLVLLVEDTLEQVYSISSRERPFRSGRCEAASISSASMPAVERREGRCARFVRIGSTSVLVMKAGAGAFVFVGLPDFPPGRNKQKADEDGNAGAAIFLCSAGRELACQWSRYRTVPVDRDFAQSALPVCADFSNIDLRTW